MVRLKRQDRAAQEERLEKFKNEAGRLRERDVVTAAEGREELHLLSFAIDGARYAIEVGRVLEIATPRTLTRVPTAGPFVRGVMSLRGLVVTIVDVRARLECGGRLSAGDRELRARHHTAGQHVIVVADSGGPTGFEVDRVLRPVKVGRDSIAPRSVEERPFDRGVFGPPDALTILLDLDKLLS